MAGISRFSAACVGVSVAALMTNPALAQDAPSNGVDSGEIVVTAQKREQALLDVPLSIQAISGAQLEESGTKELNDLLESIPGASSVSRSAPGFETIQIRGIASGTTGDATVGYYVDDVPFSVPNLQLAPPSRLFDLQRVEVLRGPQGTLYGQGAMGGTIRMVTASPDYDDVLGRFQFELSDTAGGKPSAAVDGVVNVPIAPGTVALRVSGGYELVGGFVDIVQPVAGVPTTIKKNANDTRSWNIRGKLGIRLSDALSVELGAWRVENKLDYRNTMDSVDPEIYDNSTGPYGRPNYINTDLTLLSAVVNADLGGAQLVSSTSYIDSVLDFDASFLAGGILRNQSRFNTKAFTQELRLSSTGDGPFNWLVGGYYSDGKNESDICLGLFLDCAVPFPPFNINSAGKLTTKAYAVFGELSYAMFDDRLVATVGGRYFNDKRRLSGIDRYTALPTSDRGTFDTFNPRANLSFKITDDILVYGNVAKGFRSGSFQTEAQAAAASAALGIPVSTAVQPDKVWSYEFGAKGKLFDGLITLDSAVYWIDWSDIQLQSTLNGVATVTNGGNARSKGVDLGIILKPAQGLSLQAVGNINSTEFTSVLPAIVALNPLAAPGTRIPNVPKKSLNLSANYSWSFASWGGDGFLSGGYVYRDKQLDSTGLVSDELNEFSVRAGVGKDNWKFQIFGENIGNNRSALVRTTLGVQPNFPRKIGARFSVDF